MAWEKLTTDKSVVEIVGDAVVGEKAVDTISEAANDVKELKNKAGGRSLGNTVIHPAQTLKGAGSAMKTAAVGLSLIHIYCERTDSRCSCLWSGQGSQRHEDCCVRPWWWYIRYILSLIHI